MKYSKIIPLLLGLPLILASCDNNMTDNGDSGVSGLAGFSGSNEYQLSQQLNVVEIGTADEATVLDSDQNWTNDNVYVLRGYVFIGDGDDSNSQPTLDIEEGTIIRGSVNEASTLIVNDDATIEAQGTAQQPIVFTSNAAANNRQPGDWGGLVVLGNAPINQSAPETIEGIPDGITNGTQLARYGSNNSSNVNDNSGTLQYLRIEYAGTVIGDPEEGNETNGLTLGGVGNGTTMDHIQVSFGLDDGFEFFGGTVDATHLIAYRNDDDSFDTDFGYQGNIQFAVDYRDPELVNSSGSKGFESNTNDEIESDPSDYNTQVVFSNVTLIGPARPNGSPNIDPEYTAGINLREGTALNLFNSAVIGYPSQFQLEDDETEANFTSQELRLKNVTLVVPDEPGADDITVGDEGATLSVVEDEFFTSSYNNNVVTATTTASRGDRLEEVIGLPDATWNLPDDDSDPAIAEPVPQSGSPLIGSADFSDSRLSGFQNVSYRGAFGPNSSDNTAWNLGSGWISYTSGDNSY